MVVSIDGVINLILPSRNGNYKPTNDWISYWNSFSAGDISEFDKDEDVNEMIKHSDDDRVSWLSWEVSSEDCYEYDLSWTNMRRMA